MSTALPELSPEQRQLVANTWRFRERGERIATQRFSRLAEELASVNALPEVIALAHQAVEDETRHTRLCTVLWEQYTTKAFAPFPPLTAPPLGPPSLPLRERLLYEVVAFCCLTETLNASLLLATLHIARCPQIRDTLRDILRDEIQHGRIGWAHLAAERAAGRGDFIAEAIPAMLREAGAEEIGDANDTLRSGDTLAAYGELSAELRMKVFREAIRDVIVPGLEEVGIRPQPTLEFLSSWDQMPR